MLIVIKKHKRTGQNLLLKVGRSVVSTYYLLDSEYKKIPDLNSKGRQLLDRKGRKRYKTAVCANSNVK